MEYSGTGIRPSGSITPPESKVLLLKWLIRSGITLAYLPGIITHQEDASSAPSGTTVCKA